MAAINRTIYTQSEVRILSGSDAGPWAVVSGVQNASVSYNSPNQTVNAFGTKGIIDNVQLEPETATTTSYFSIKNERIDAKFFVRRSSPNACYGSRNWKSY